MAEPYNVLFLCVGNSARSILAEALLNAEGGDRFRAFSAGSDPRGEVHPAALKALTETGYSTDGLRSKSWDEYGAADAPWMDFVFAVCGDAVDQICPVWPGHPITAYWGIRDPAAVQGPRQSTAFAIALHQLRHRISLFLSLPVESLDPMSLRQRLDEIGTFSRPAVPIG